MITAGGTLTGTAVDWSSGSPQQVTLSGTVSSTGAASITTKSSQNTNLNTGNFYFNSAGDLVGLLTNNNAGSSPTTTAVTLTTAGKPLIYSGSYTGSAMDLSSGSGGNITPITSLTISSTGALAATASGSNGGTVTGTINSSGVANLKIKNSDGSTNTGTGYFAFDNSGLLQALVIDSDDSLTQLTLTKSYAGIYEIPVGDGSTAYFTVSDTGVVTGSSVSSSNPFTLTGTVSAAGVVNITGKPTGSGDTTGTATLTGTMTATGSGFIGNGNLTVTGGSPGTWSATGMPSTGLVYGGSYSISLGAGTALTITVNADGTITGTGSGGAAGTNVTGAVLASGAVYIFATPTAAGSANGTATLIGTFTRTGNKFTGSGTLTVLDGNTGSWTATGTAA